MTTNDTLRPPKKLRPVLRSVIDRKTGRPRLSDHTRSALTVYVCPYCYAWSSGRKQVEDCCDRHHERLLTAWAALVENGIASAAVPSSPHLPILTLPDATGHLVGEAGAYVLELPDGRRFARADAVTLVDTVSPDLAGILRAALTIWPPPAPK